MLADVAKRPVHRLELRIERADEQAKKIVISPKLGYDGV
jgi:hypothetical protein